MFFKMRLSHFNKQPLLSRAASSIPRGISSILEKKCDDVVITWAKRTPVGRAKKGQFKYVPVEEMLFGLFKVALSETQLDPAKIEDICIGTCHPPSPLYISRAAALAAGVPNHVPISTVNRLCSSGLMAIRNIAHVIQSGEISLGFAAGTDSMSLNPRPTPRISDLITENDEARDCIESMGWTSEMVAKNYKVSRQRQDEIALISHTRAANAAEKGLFADEIAPITLRGKTYSEDDTIRKGVTLEALSALKPAFPDWGDGTTTAGNASGVGDGAGLCILSTRDRAEKEGMQIVGKWVSSAVVGVEPRYMGIAPTIAIPKLLEQVNLSKDDIDVYEINEAFASQFAYCVDQLGIPLEKINPNGGAIAVSHPLGMTGVRQVVTGLSELRRRDAHLLMTSMCIGSGMGAAGLFVNEV